MDVPRIEIRIFDTGHEERAQSSHHLRHSKSGALQQGWIITTYNALGDPIGQRLEWREIPVET
jgi:hypothetical protein